MNARRRTIFQVSSAALLSLALSLPADADQRVPLEEQQATRGVRGEFRNPVGSPAAGPACALFGGSVDGVVGVAPGDAPSDGAGHVLLRSSFGQAVGGRVPFAGFATAAIDRAESLLYFQRGDDDVLPENDDPGQGVYSAAAAAYAYKDLMYGSSSLACAMPIPLGRASTRRTVRRVTAVVSRLRS